MLPSQRDQFDIPREICYLNAAAWGPLPIAAQSAGQIGAARKARPWNLAPGWTSAQDERARAAAARLINADADDVAIISSVSYGVATAGKLISPPTNRRILLLQDDHASPSLEWMTRYADQIDLVKQPADGDWTAAVLEAIGRTGAAPVGLASISSVHWSDGGMLDLPAVAAALRAQGAILLVDATHSVGILGLDVRTLDPDFVVFPTYKWLLGPYGRAFLYIARRWQNGAPLEQTAGGRRAIDAAHSTYMRDIGYVDNARRFDMGEREHFISLETAAIGMELVASWGSDALTRRLLSLTQTLAEGLRDLDVLVPRPQVRAPHILSLGFPQEMPADLISGLAGQGVHVAGRLGRMRISPHAYNDENDIDRFLQVFRRLYTAQRRQVLQRPLKQGLQP